MSLKTVTAVVGMLALACAGTVFGAQKKPFLSTYRWGTGGCEKGLYDQWEQWVGGPVWAEDFMPKDAWNKIEGEAWQLGVWSKWRTFAPGRRLVLSVPMLVGPWNRSGPKTGPHAGEPVSLAKGAAGEYDAHFEVLGRNLVKWGLADTIVRLGWEFNGGWYTYRAENEREARDFAAFFRRAVDAMRKADGQKFLFCWNPAMEPHWNYDIEAAWPGDDHVDIIGLDVYDQSWVPDTYPMPENATREERVARQDRAWKLKTANEKAFGLTWWPAFARRHGNKPLAICEWGVCHRDDGHGGEDDPLFIDRMADFILDPENNVMFHCYFDVGADDGNHQLIPDGKNKICFPESTAAFHKRFAKPGTPAVPPPFKSIWTKPADGSRQNEMAADVVIYGSSPAALTAAIEAQRHGKSAVIVCQEKRIGGLTTGGLGQTDIGNKDAFGGLALQFYRDVADWYKSEANWKYEKREDYMPDGQCADSMAKDSMWTFEPHAALAILERWERQNRLRIFRGEFLDRGKGVAKENGRIISIRTLSGKVLRGKMFVDATYEGDLMAAAGVSYTVGREANAVYGETISGVARALAENHQFNKGVSAYVKPGDPSSGLLPFLEPDTDEPDGTGDRRVQAYCFRMCLTDDPSNRIPFAKPKGYRDLDYELLLRNLEAIDPKVFVDDAKRPWKYMPWINSRMPNRKTDTNNRTGFSTDFVGQNHAWPEASYEERAKMLKAHLDYQMGLMWTLANNPRVPEPIRCEVARWGTCRDEFQDGLGGGWQSQLYVREGRRMVGDYVATEHDVLRRRTTSRPVAMAAYGMDSHNVRRYVDKNGFARNEGNVEDWRAGGKPYPLDYGVILPKKADCENLFVPVCVSASHMAFGSIRMEPVFFALGQVAGAAAALAIDAGCAAQDLEYAKLRDVLVSEGQVVSRP